MKTSKIIAISAFSALLLPVIALAVTLPGEPTGGLTNFTDIFTKVGSIVWPVAMGIAFIVFLIAGIMFMTAAGDPTKVATARNWVLYGVVGVVVAILAYSIVTIVSTTVGGGT